MADLDAELVARLIARDDPTAFTRLVRRYQSPMRSFFRRLVPHDAALADDLAQEAFLKVFRSIGAFHGNARFTTWLYRVAYNVFLDHQRKRGATAPLEHANESPSGDRVEALHDQIDMDRLLNLLPDRQRAVFDLHYRKDMSHQEIADALGVPLGTVKSDLARGIDDLRRRVRTRGAPDA